MSQALTVELVTPERVALETAADFVVLPAFQGELGILPGHEAAMVQLQAGEVRVTVAGEIRRFAVSGGFVEVHEDRIAIFAESAEMAQEIDIERAKQSLARAQAEKFRRTGDSLTLAQAEAAMDRARIRLKIAGLRLRPGSRGSLPPRPGV